MVPCSLRNKPHALQRMFPLGSFLHSGVLDVPQLLQVVSVLAVSLAGTEEEILDLASVWSLFG